VESLLERLRTLAEGDAPALQTHLLALGRLIGAEKPLAAGFSERSGEPAAAFLYGPPSLVADLRRLVEPMLRARPRDWGLFDPARPDPRQRNVALTSADLRALADLESLPVVREVFPSCGLSGLDELRVLVCEEASLLAWVGGFRQGAFGEPERLALQRLVPGLRHRLLLERHLRDAPLAFAALDAALEAIGAAAFVVRDPGEVVLVNRAGRALLDRDRAGALERLRQALAGQDGACVSRLESPGVPPHHLAILPADPPDAAARAGALAARWGLTPRQRQVLALVARGLSNKAIAAELACAESTVELHVSALLWKTGCEHRAEVVARFWTG